MCDGHAGVAKRAVREAEANEGKGTPSQAKRKRMDNQISRILVPRAWDDQMQEKDKNW